MKKSGRYKAVGIEAEKETGSFGKISRNLLGIIDQRELDRVENIALKQAEDIFFRKLVHGNKRFTAKDICNMQQIRCQAPSPGTVTFSSRVR